MFRSTVVMLALLFAMAGSFALSAVLTSRAVPSSVCTYDSTTHQCVDTGCDGCVLEGTSCHCALSPRLGSVADPASVRW